MTISWRRSNRKDLIWHRGHVHLENRELRNEHRAVVVWFTGLSGSGKSTIAHGVEKVLFERNAQAYVLDGDNVRHGLCSDLGFGEGDRHENIRRIGELVRLFMDAGMIVLTAFISPYRRDREWVEVLVGPQRFIEVYCRCPVAVCEGRDPKGLYRRARAGEIQEFTGISAPYEEPASPSLTLDTSETDVGEAVAQVVRHLEQRGVVSS